MNFITMLAEKPIKHLNFIKKGKGAELQPQFTQNDKCSYGFFAWKGSRENGLLIIISKSVCWYWYTIFMFSNSGFVGHYITKPVPKPFIAPLEVHVGLQIRLMLGIKFII